MRSGPPAQLTGTATYLLLGVVVFLTGCSGQGEAQMTEKYLIECTLEAEETYVAGEPVNLRFSLHNQTDRTLYILMWYTPLEGMAGDIFHIEKDGEPVPYQGVLAKRGDPSRDEYTAVKTGAAVSAMVNLGEDYDLSQVGRYHVEFTSRLHDVTDDEPLIPRKRDDHQPQGLPCNTVSFEIVHPGT